MRELRTRSWLSLHTRKAVRRGHPHQHGGKHVQEIRHSYTYQVGRESLPRWGTRLQRCGTSHGDQGVGRHSSHSPDNAADVLRGPRRKAGSPTTDRRVRRRGFRHGGRRLGDDGLLGEQIPRAAPPKLFRGGVSRGQSTT